MRTNVILISLIVAGILIRITFGIIYYHESQPKSWEYGAIAQNLISGNGYSLFKPGNNKLDINPSINEEPKPSAFMMPGYTFLIIPFFGMGVTYYYFIFAFQALLAGLTAYLMYDYVRRMCDKSTALLSVSLFLFLPEFIYSSNTIGPTTVFHLLLIVFFYLENMNGKKMKKSILSGITAALLIYFRPESLLFLILYFMFLLFRRQTKKVIIMSLIMVILISPWVIRNYLVFEKVIPLTTSTGLNLYRGHNPYYNGFWMDEILHAKIFTAKYDNKFEIRMNEIYLNEVEKNVKGNPIRELTNIYEKVLNLWLVNFNDVRSNNLFYIVPWIIILSLFIYGIFRKNSLPNSELHYIYIISTTLTAVIFFVLPRYQTIMKIAVIPFAASSFMYILRKLSKRD